MTQTNPFANSRASTFSLRLLTKRSIMSCPSVYGRIEQLINSTTPSGYRRVEHDNIHYMKRSRLVSESTSHLYTTTRTCVQYFRSCVIRDPANRSQSSNNGGRPYSGVSRSPAFEVPATIYLHGVKSFGIHFRQVEKHDVIHPKKSHLITESTSTCKRPRVPVCNVPLLHGLETLIQTKINRVLIGGLPCSGVSLSPAFEVPAPIHSYEAKFLVVHFRRVGTHRGTFQMG